MLNILKLFLILISNIDIKKTIIIEKINLLDANIRLFFYKPIALVCLRILMSFVFLCISYYSILSGDSSIMESIFCSPSVNVSPFDGWDYLPSNLPGLSEGPGFPGGPTPPNGNDLSHLSPTVQEYASRRKDIEDKCTRDLNYVRKREQSPSDRFLTEKAKAGYALRDIWDQRNNDIIDLRSEFEERFAGEKRESEERFTREKLACERYYQNNAFDPDLKKLNRAELYNLEGKVDRWFGERGIRGKRWNQTRPAIGNLNLTAYEENYLRACVLKDVDSVFSAAEKAMFRSEFIGARGLDKRFQYYLEYTFKAYDME